MVVLAGHRRSPAASTTYFLSSPNVSIMGVLGLFAALVRYLAAVSVRWSLPPSSRISIDGSPAIHMALHENYAACVKDGDYSGFYKTFVRHLRHAKEWAAATAKITVVFDGPRSDSKRVNMERAARAKSATRKAAARSSGRRTRAAAAAAAPTRSEDQLLKAAAHGLSIDALPYAIQACIDEGVDFLVAPAEAEAQIIYRERSGLCDFTAGNDSDFIVQQTGGSRHFLRIPGSWSPYATKNQYLRRSSLANPTGAEWNDTDRFLDKVRRSTPVCIHVV